MPQSHSPGEVGDNTTQWYHWPRQLPRAGGQSLEGWRAGLAGRQEQEEGEGEWCVEQAGGSLKPRIPAA